jgi:hypothetical protein
MKLALYAFMAMGGIGMIWKALIGNEAVAIHWLFGIMRSHPAFWACVKKYEPEIKQAINIAHDASEKEIDQDPAPKA